MGRTYTPSEHLLTTEEVAEYFRTAPGTVRYWRHIGRGPASFKVGRRVLYRESDVQEWQAAALSCARQGSSTTGPLPSAKARRGKRTAA